MRPGRIKPIFILPLFLACGSPSNTTSTTELRSDPPAVVSLSLSEDLDTLKQEVNSLEAMVWGECTVNCLPVKVKKLIKANKVNSHHLENEMWGIEVTEGYSWDKHKYFGSQTMDDFLQVFLKENTLKFNLDRLCALKEIVPISDGKFEVGVYTLADNPNIDANCGVLFDDLTLGTTATIEDFDEGGFAQKITLDGDVLYLKVTPDIFAFGQYSSIIRRRLTYDKIKHALSVETLKFLAGQDSLVRVYYDGAMGKASIFSKEVDPEEIVMAYSAEMGMLVPRFAKLDIKADSLGGVDDVAPEAKGCIDLEKGLISQYSYDNCPMDFGLSLADTSPALLDINYTPGPEIVEAIEFIDEDDVYLKDL